MTNSGQLVELLHKIISTLTSAVFGIYPDGSVFLWSQGAAELAGVNANRALGKKFESLLKFPKETPVLAKLLETQAQVSYEFEVSKGNETKNLKLVLTPLLNDDQKLIGAVGEIIDTSEEKRLEQLRVDFISMVAHELRTPASIIKSYLDTIQKEATSLNPELREYLTRAYTANERQIQTIEGIFNVSRLEEKTLIINLQKLELLPVLSEILNEFQDEAHSKNIELNLIYPRFPIPPVSSDPLRLREILRNIIGNALKYMQKGSISISTEQDQDKLVVNITDTGPGIPPELQPHLFEKFTRGDHALSEFTQGTGLGLYIARKFVELMGGTIWFETKVSFGTTFHFSLPIA